MFSDFFVLWFTYLKLRLYTASKCLGISLAFLRKKMGTMNVRKARGKIVHLQLNKWVAALWKHELAFRTKVFSFDPLECKHAHKNSYQWNTFELNKLANYLVVDDCLCWELNTLVKFRQWHGHSVYKRSTVCSAKLVRFSTVKE